MCARHRFKLYGVYYIVHEQKVWILAIFHGRRHPRTLEERRSEITRRCDREAAIANTPAACAPQMELQLTRRLLQQEIALEMRPSFQYHRGVWTT